MVASFPGFYLAAVEKTLLHSCEKKSGSGLGTRLTESTILFDVHYIHLFPISQLRYSRSPSPVADLGYESQYTSSRSSLPTRPKGLTTMTSMIISNLSDTVSKNDVSVSSVFPLRRIFQPPIVVATPEILGYFSIMTQPFLVRKLVISSQTMHTVSYEFLIKPEESAKCHQTLSSQVGSGHETTW